MGVYTATGAAQLSRGRVMHTNITYTHRQEELELMQISSMCSARVTQTYITHTQLQIDRERENACIYYVYAAFEQEAE